MFLTTIQKLNCKKCRDAPPVHSDNECEDPKTCLCAEREHDKKKETPIQDEFQEGFSNMMDKYKTTLENKQLLRDTDILIQLVDIISKTVKGDVGLTYHLLFNGFSAFTEKQIHLMIMEKTSEGKTYPALEIANYFPKDNVIILASMTPQTFKYDYGVLVNENHEPIQEQLEQLEEA